jgi:hypothetical protein
VSSLSSKYPGGITVFGLQMEKKKSMDIHRNLSRQTIRIIINPLLKQVLGVSLNRTALVAGNSVPTDSKYNNYGTQKSVGHTRSAGVSSWGKG